MAASVKLGLKQLEEVLPMQLASRSFAAENLGDGTDVKDCTYYVSQVFNVSYTDDFCSTWNFANLTQL
jgi:hypothetical protein